MTGDERKRFCGECGKHVYNMSAMSEKEARAFADETQGRECVAYVRTDDGLMQSPGFMERLLMRVAGKRPRLSRVLAALLPAALAACIARPRTGVSFYGTTAGYAGPPATAQGNTGQHQPVKGKALTVPAPIPLPGRAAPPKSGASQ